MNARNGLSDEGLMALAPVLNQFARMMAAQVVELLDARTEPQSDGWLDSDAAAAHLGIDRPALHRLTSARKLVFSQAERGGPCYFRRRDLDAYREQHMRGSIGP